MTAFELSSDDGTKTAQIDMPPPDGKPGALAVAFHKAGSVMLDGVLGAMCQHSGRSYVNIDTELFGQGRFSKDYDRTIGQAFLPSGYVYGVFRTYLDSFAGSTVKPMKKIILVRDPRDVVVSYYFSMRYSHSVPKQGEARDALLNVRSETSNVSLDDSVLGNKFEYLFENMKKITHLINTENVILYKYEDIIFKKADWFDSLAKDIGVDLDQEFKARLLERFDVVPEEEKSDKHIRRVTPGDHKDKLSRDAIRHLQIRHMELFQALGY